MPTKRTDKPLFPGKCLPQTRWQCQCSLIPFACMDLVSRACVSMWRYKCFRLHPAPMCWEKLICLFHFSLNYLGNQTGQGRATPRSRRGKVLRSALTSGSGLPPVRLLWTHQPPPGANQPSASLIQFGGRLNIILYLHEGFVCLQMLNSLCLYANANIWLLWLSSSFPDIFKLYFTILFLTIKDVFWI